MCRSSFLADLLGNYYLFEILHTSLTVENSGNVVKRGCFGKPFYVECQLFAVTKVEYKVCYFIRRSVFILGIAHLTYCKNAWSFCDEELYFCEIKEGRKASRKNIFFNWNQYLCEILPTSLTVKKNENVAKSECFGEMRYWERHLLGSEGRI